VKKGFLFPFAVNVEAPPGGRVSSLKVTTEKLDFPDTFDDSLFTFDFPPGTEITDEVLHLTYTAGRIEVPEDELRQILAESPEAPSTGSDITTAETPPVAVARAQPIPSAPVGRWPARLLSFLAVFALAIAAVAAVVAARRRKVPR
jgi:hypothetical protein